jgi:hypothetical protein
LFDVSAAGRTRTYDRLVNSQPLYRAELRRLLVFMSFLLIFKLNFNSRPCFKLKTLTTNVHAFDMTSFPGFQEAEQERYFGHLLV